MTIELLAVIVICVVVLALVVGVAALVILVVEHRSDEDGRGPDIGND